MKPSPHTWLTITLCVVAVALAALGASAAPLLNSGDLDVDGRITVADVIALENILSGGNAQGLQAALADANQDGATDTNDTSFLVDVVLQREAPLPLIQMAPLAIVSFWKPQESLSAADVTLTAGQQVSFWKPMEPLTIADASLANAHPVSLWKPVDINNIEVRDDNAIQTGPPSFDRLVE